MIASSNPLDKAAFLVGGRSELASGLGVTPAAVGNWKVRGVPIEHCAEIERLTGGGVGRRDLRPNDWQRIWPELAANQPQQPAGQGAEGAAHA